MTRCCLVVLVLSSGVAHAQLSFGPDSPIEEVGEDFESSLVFGRPASQLFQFSASSPYDAGTVFVTLEAAHRGSAGVRFEPRVLRRLADGGVGLRYVEGPVLPLYEEPASLVAPDAGLYFRMWLRVNASPTPAQTPLIFNFLSESGIMLDSRPTGWRLRNSGANAVEASSALIRPRTWHLVEFEYVRSPSSDGGSRGGSMRFWLDGSLHSTQPNVSSLGTTPINMSAGVPVVGHAFGIVEQYGPTAPSDLDGSIDFDDVRRSRRPPGSVLALEQLPAVSADCPLVRQVRVKLRSSQGTTAFAPYVVGLTLDAGPSLAVGRLDNGCLASGVPAFSVGAEAIDVAVEGPSMGVLTVTSPDFFPASLNLMPQRIVDSGVADAGTGGLGGRGGEAGAGGGEPQTSGDGGPVGTPLLGCSALGAAVPVSGWLLLLSSLSVISSRSRRR